MTYKFLLCALLCTGYAFSSVPRPFEPNELEIRHKKMNDQPVPTTYALDQDSERTGKLRPFAGQEELKASMEAYTIQERALSDKAEADLKSFCTAGGIELMPVATQTSTDATTEPDKKQADKQVSKGKDKKGKNAEGEETEMVVTSEDGVYFDSEEGLLVYLRDVHLTDPRFTLDCDNQLKIYLEEGPKKGDKTSKKEEGKPNPAQDKAVEPAKDAPKSAEDQTASDESKMKTPDFGSLNFSGIKYISATGNVKIKRVDESGKIMRAEAHEVTYDGKTGEIVLSGGDKQFIEDGKNRIETAEPGSYIRIFGNGSIYVKGKRVTTKIVNDGNSKSPFSSKK